MTNESEGLPEVDIVSIGVAAGGFGGGVFGVMHLDGIVLREQSLNPEFPILKLGRLLGRELHEKGAIRLVSQEFLINTISILQIKASNDVCHSSAEDSRRLETERNVGPCG